MSLSSTPRILPTNLPAFSPYTQPRPSTTTVRVLGSITSLYRDQAVLESGSHGSVTLILNRDPHLTMGDTYEVVGKVITLERGMGLGLRVLGYTEWPKNAQGKGVSVDMKAYEAVVDATHRYKEIFYEGGGWGGMGMDGAMDE